MVNFGLHTCSDIDQLKLVKRAELTLYVSKDIDTIVSFITFVKLGYGHRIGLSDVLYFKYSRKQCMK